MEWIGRCQLNRGSRNTTSARGGDIDVRSSGLLRVMWQRRCQEFWEALRLVGDAEEGHGTFPSTLKDKIIAAGAAWLFAAPTERVVPKCWETYLQRTGFSYRKALPVMTQQPKDERDMRRLFGYPVMYTKATQHQGTLRSSASADVFQRGLWVRARHPRSPRLIRSVP
ncbi:hypothetical protein F4803DRAFT_528473 [Xylaria telfairii]|nr:hypothetical protein F4803DRAFT_528473 [Xylaria telfairii]